MPSHAQVCSPTHTIATPVVHEHTLLHLWAHTVPGMCTYRMDLTCVLWLQVEKPGKGQPLHFSWGQNIIPNKSK